MNASSPVDELERRFGLGEALRFELDAFGHARGVVTHPEAHGEFYLRGAHVTRWHPADQPPVLWRCPHVPHDDVTAGGIPICFPWFGRGPTPGTSSHGVARLAAWELTESRANDGGVYVELRTACEPFALRLAVHFGRSLTVSLHITNDSAAHASCEAALHSYFAIFDSAACVVRGLEGSRYLDKTKDFVACEADDEPLRFTTQEVDRIYLRAPAECTVDDPGHNRRLRITKHGGENTVVWSPGTRRGAALPAFNEGAWARVLCIEAAAVREHRLTLSPRSSHTLSASVQVHPLQRVDSGFGVTR